MNTQKLINIANEKLLSITDRPNIVIKSGKGMYLWDTEDNKYLDFIGGWAVCTLGHSPDVIHEAITQQSLTVINSSPSFYNQPMLKFSKLLVDNSVFDRVWFGNTGSEVNEAAIKIARKYGQLNKNGAFEIITTESSFHGRTLAMMSATGKSHWKGLFGPNPEGFIHVPFNDLDSIKSRISSKTAAIMIEPIQGEGGVNVPSKSYIKGLRALCDREDILLIFDEVQTGYGRTGTMFAYEQYGIEPDIMTLAKGIGAGFPLSAILTKERLNIFDKGDHGGTYGGQQLAMSVGLAVLNKILNSNILENVVNTGDYLVNSLKRLEKEFSLSNIRGKGLLLGVDLPGNNAQEIVKRALENGLIINTTGPNKLRFMPPLIVTKKEIDIMIEILVKTLRECK